MEKYDLPLKIVKTRKSSASISISVRSTGIRVTAPIWIPSIFINKFISSKHNWILEQVERVKLPSVKKGIVNDSTIPFFGKKLKVVYHADPNTSLIKIELEDTQLKVIHPPGYTPDLIENIAEKRIKAWIFERALVEITDRANHFAKRLEVSYTKITLKKVSSIWGSCSPDNSLTFSQQLAGAPLAVVEYVIIHELCHIVHRDHSSRFWALVRSLDKDYKDHRRWLRDNRQELNIY